VKKSEEKVKKTCRKTLKLIVFSSLGRNTHSFHGPPGAQKLDAARRIVAETRATELRIIREIPIGVVKINFATNVVRDL